MATGEADVGAREAGRAPWHGAFRRRWNEARAAIRADDFEALIDLDSRANRQLMMLLFGTLLLGASLIGTVAILPYADRLELATHTTLIRCVLAVALGLATLLIPFRDMPMWVIDAVVVSAVTFIGFAVAATPQPIAGYLVLFYLWPLVALVVLRSERACLAHFVYVLVTSGLVLGFDDDFSSRLYWWGLCLLTAATVWWSTGWLVRRARQLAVVERGTRARSEHASNSLVALNHQKSQFLGAMSHELRTPLNAVIGFAQMLRRHAAGPVNAAQATYIDDILDSGRHLLALIDDALDEAKVESGEYRLELEDVVVGDVIDDAVRFVRERAERADIRLEVAPDRSEYVRLDERKIRQVLMNLLSNAVKFTPAGGKITVAARRASRSTVFVVQDTGPGVAPEARYTVFDEFERAGAASAVEGTGLGLAVARAFVELHGGQIRVDSPFGGGARFSFSIPLNPPPPPATRRSEEAADAGRALTARGDILDLGEIVDRMLVFTALVLTGVAVGGLVDNSPGVSQTFFVFAAAMAAVSLPVLVLAKWHLSDRSVAVVGLAMNSIITVTALVGVHLLGVLAPGAVLVVVGTGIFFRLFGHASRLLVHPGRIHATVAGVGIALALGVGSGNTAPLLQWAIAICTLGVNSLLIGSLFDRLQLLVGAERCAAVQAAAVAAELDEVSRHKSHFLAGMSHELRTPLNAVIGFAEALQREIPGPLTEVQRAYVGDIALSGRHLLDVINQTLDLAKIDAGRLELRTRPVELAALLDLAVVPSRSLAAGKDVVIEVADGITAMVPADEARLAQAVGSVIRNAVQHSPRLGTVAIGVVACEAHVLISVTDSGHGVSEGQEAAIFEPFHQGSADPTVAREGAGLGLALARRLIELHGGTITVASEPESGATFTLSVPNTSLV